MKMTTVKMKTLKTRMTGRTSENKSWNSKRQCENSIPNSYFLIFVELSKNNLYLAKMLRRTIQNLIEV